MLQVELRVVGSENGCKVIVATCTGRIRDVVFTPYDGAEQSARLTFQLATRRYVGSRWLVSICFVRDIR